MDRPQAARHGARAASSRAALLPRDSGCSCALARATQTRESRLICGRSWHVVPRPRVDGERPLAGAETLFSAWTERNQRGTARARRKLECYAFSRDTAIAGVRALGSRATAGLVLEAKAGTSYHGRARMEGGLSLVQCHYTGPKPSTTSAARRAPAASLTATPSPERHRAPARVRFLLHTRQPAWRWRPQLAQHTMAVR